MIAHSIRPDLGGGNLHSIYSAIAIFQRLDIQDGLTVVEYPIPERGGMAESVTPESIDELHSKNNYGGYCPTNGTITYSLKNTAEKNSFNIVLAPDTTLWNRTKGQTLIGDMVEFRINIAAIFCVVRQGNGDLQFLKTLKDMLIIRTYTGDIEDTTNQISYDTISATAKITGKYNDAVVHLK